MIYAEPPLVLRVIREHFTKDFRRLLIDNQDTYDNVVGLPRRHRGQSDITRQDL